MSQSFKNFRYHIGYNVGTCVKQFVLDSSTDDLKFVKARVLALRAIGQQAYAFDNVTKQAVSEEAMENY